MKWGIVSLILFLVCLLLLSVPATASPTPTNTVSGKIPLIISNVQYSDITSSTTTISWDTNAASTSQVIYDGTQTPVDSNLVSSHNVQLTGLLPSTIYHFRVQSTATAGGLDYMATSEDYWFETLAAPILKTLDITANPDSIIQTCVSASSTITVTARDQYYQIMPGVVINLNASSSGNLSPSVVTTGTSGQASAVLTFPFMVTQPTMVTVYATSAGIQGQTQVTFIPPPLKPTNVIIYAAYPNPSDYGQTVNFGVWVSGHFWGIPTGTVAYYDITDGTNAYLGTSDLFLGLTGFDTRFFSVGTHIIKAVYSGDRNFASSTSNIWMQKVRYDTTTTLTAIPNPSTVGQSVTFKATVKVQSLGTVNPTSGAVTFFDGPNIIGRVNLSGSNLAVLSYSSLPAGSRCITAFYDADGNYDSSLSNTLTQKVNKANTSTVLVSSGSAVFGQPVTFTATVTPSLASGSITFKDGSTSLKTVALSGGSASLSSSTLKVGSHDITAVYSGDSNYNGSNSSKITQTVSKANTTTTLVNNSSQKTVTAMVTAAAPGNGIPGGKVTFVDVNSNKTLGTVTLNVSGQAKFSPPNSSKGHSIKATYSGDGNFTTSLGTVIFSY